MFSEAPYHTAFDWRCLFSPSWRNRDEEARFVKLSLNQMVKRRNTERMSKRLLNHGKWLIVWVISHTLSRLFLVGQSMDLCWEKQASLKKMLVGHIWMFNPPASSHFGGVWKRQIWTIRKVLISVVKQQTVDEEGLQTLVCEVEAIMNSRPITKISYNLNDLEALTLNYLLLLKKPIIQYRLLFLFERCLLRPKMVANPVSGKFVFLFVLWYLNTENKKIPSRYKTLCKYIEIPKKKKKGNINIISCLIRSLMRETIIKRYNQTLYYCNSFW